MPKHAWKKLRVGVKAFDSEELLELLTRREWDTALELINARKGKVETGILDWAADRLLCEACKNRPPTAVLKSILHSFPETVKKPDGCGNLPLHYACSRGASREAVLVLLTAYPNAARKPDGTTNLPLHRACRHGASPGVVGALVLAYPEAVGEKNRSGYTPAMLANTSMKRMLTDDVCDEEIATLVNDFSCMPWSAGMGLLVQIRPELALRKADVSRNLLCKILPKISNLSAAFGIVSYDPGLFAKVCHRTETSGEKKGPQYLPEVQQFQSDSEDRELPENGSIIHQSIQSVDDEKQEISGQDETKETGKEAAIALTDARSNTEAANVEPARPRATQLRMHACDLSPSLGMCCEDMDKRPGSNTDLYDRYVDGVGWVADAPRYEFYCPSCQESCRRGADD